MVGVGGCVTLREVRASDPSRTACRAGPARELREYPADQQSGRHAEHDKARGIGENPADHLRRRSPQSQKDADLASALNHRVARRPIQTDSGQQQSQCLRTATRSWHAMSPSLASAPCGRIPLRRTMNYSPRRMAMRSRRSARRAGMQQAASAPMARSRATAA
jgi:hypothetical protein